MKHLNLKGHSQDEVRRRRDGRPDDWKKKSRSNIVQPHSRKTTTTREGDQMTRNPTQPQSHTKPECQSDTRLSYFINTRTTPHRSNELPKRSNHSIFSLVFFAAFFFSSFVSPCNGLMTDQRKLELRDMVKQTWYHGFGNYMKHAFPDDELQPLSCRGISQDHQNSNNHERNDVLGDFSMTLIDTIDTFIALQDYANFELAIRKIIQTIPNFDIDSKVQVFETTIRVLGGLLSGHLFAKYPSKFFSGIRHHPHQEIDILDDYNDQLLFLAKDLTDRMLPAFEASKTGIPYARINLRHGVVPGEGTETCTAGAGSLLLEFATLSRLIGDSKYENVAKKAFFALWNRRSSIDLLGNTINLQSGFWSYGISSIGAGIDSFYEYILKAHVLLQDDSFLDIWNQAYKSVMTYMKSSDGFWYRGVNMQTGAVATTTVDSLAAFWPGLQVLAGDIEGAIKSHMIYANLWARYSGIPEVFDVHQRQATALGYPLRPEFIESNYFLYRATKDEYYLEVAERVITDLVNRTWVDCGLASIENLNTGKLEDRMHSFMLSETLKYLYLTFDEANPINHLDEPFIFTTEGHILYIPNAQDFPENQRSSDDQSWEERESLDTDQLVKDDWRSEKVQASQTISKRKPQTCQVFSPSLRASNPKHSSQLKLSVTGRTDFEYAKMITGSQDSPITPYLNQSHHPSSSEFGDPSLEFGNSWFEFGLCEVPSVDDNLIELIFSRSEEDIERGSLSEKVELFELPSNSKKDPFTFSGSDVKDAEDAEEYTGHIYNQSYALVKNLTGLTFSLRKSHDQDNYEIVNIGAYSLPTRTTVILSDPYAVNVLKPQTESEKISKRDRDHLTAIRVSYDDPSGAGAETLTMERVVMMATFGPDVRIPGSTDLSLGRPPIGLVQLSPSNQHGCEPVDGQSLLQGMVVLVERGQCTFADKLEHAVQAGAKAVLVVNDDESLLIPTSDRIEARDEKENLLSKFDPNPSLEIDPALHLKLKSIPLLFANRETGTSLQTLLDQNLRVSVNIQDNPFQLIDQISSSSPANSFAPHQPSPRQMIVINGYKLSNLILKTD